MESGLGSAVAQSETRGAPRPGGEAGVSLVELMAGMVLAVLLVSGLLTGVVAHQNQRRVHGEQILAMATCRNVLETLREASIDDLPSNHGRGFDIPGPNDVPGVNDQPLGLLPMVGDADGLAGEIAVTRHADWATGNELYIVTATVRWRGVTRAGLFSMETLMGERR